MLIAASGHASALEARLAGARAAADAVRLLGRYEPRFAILAVSHELPLDQVLQGAASSLGDSAVLAFSTSGELSNAGADLRSVSIGLLAGDDLAARGGWWPGFRDEPRSCIQEMLKSLQPQSSPGSLLLLAGEGLGGEPEILASELPPGNYALAGCLAGGELSLGRTWQAGGAPVTGTPALGTSAVGAGPAGGSASPGIPSCGAGGLAAVLLQGGLSLGLGAAHGWTDVGIYARLDKSSGPWVRRMGGRTPAEFYGQHFGYPERDWAFPPLNHIVRLYPLGIETQDNAEMQVRAPLRMEADGSLRMSTPVRQGAFAHILVGSPQACLDAARQAAQQALAGLGGRRPLLGLLLVDAAWQTLLEAAPGAEVEAIRAVLGNELPVVGGYVSGQVAPLQPGGSPRYLNNHILVALIGE